MGNTLPRPVTCKVVDRVGNTNFKAAACSMNGYREHMEDAHSMIPEENWGYFAVFDGHSGTKCSKFCSERFPKEIEKAEKPIPDATLEEITLKTDAEFLSTIKEAGSTATMFVAYKQKDKPGFYDIQVANVGDSRVIIVQNGECVSMTTDHKPSIESERERIERCGGTVSGDRVDGMLAMSRAMGDGEYKNGEGSQLEQKVTPQPDIRHHVCGPTDYVLVCCDGIFESQFSNEEVVAFVHDQVEKNIDIGEIMCALCEEALARGSTDNMTAMLVQFQNGSTYGPPCEFVPSYIHPHKGFTNAYTVMAEMAGLTYGQALERRYDQLTKILAEHPNNAEQQTETGDKPKDAKEGTEPVSDEYQKQQDEMDRFQIENEKGPPKDLTGEERTNWFEKLAAVPPDSQQSKDEGWENSRMVPLSLLYRLAGVEPPDSQKGPPTEEQ